MDARIQRLTRRNAHIAKGNVEGVVLDVAFDAVLQRLANAQVNDVVSCIALFF